MTLAEDMNEFITVINYFIVVAVVVKCFKSTASQFSTNKWQSVTIDMEINFATVRAIEL